jgi:hypothetical protein
MRDDKIQLTDRQALANHLGETLPAEITERQGMAVHTRNALEITATFVACGYTKKTGAIFGAAEPVIVRAMNVPAILQACKMHKDYLRKRIHSYREDKELNLKAQDAVSRLISAHPKLAPVKSRRKQRKTVG